MQRSPLKKCQLIHQSSQNLFENLRPITHPVHAEKSMEVDRSLSQSRKSRKLLLLSKESSNHKDKNEGQKIKPKRSNIEFTPKRINQRKLQNQTLFILDGHNDSKERGSSLKKKMMKMSSDFKEEINKIGFDNSYYNKYERKKEAIKNYYYYNNLNTIFNQKKEMMKKEQSFVNDEDGEVFDSETAHRIPNSNNIFNRSNGKKISKLDVWKDLVEKYEGLIDKMLTKKIKMKDSQKLFQEVNFFLYF